MAHEAPHEATVATMAVLFDPEPTPWGLRGDPHVWRAMRDRLSGTDVPAAVDEATAQLRAVFAELVGLDLAEADVSSVYRQEYAHGGMSSGMVDLDTWRERLMPLLVERARALLGG